MRPVTLDRDSMIATVQRYIDSWRDGDLEARGRLFAERAFVEDPVGSPPLEGLRELTESWTSAARHAATYEPTLRRIVICGHEALVEYAVRISPTHGPVNTIEAYALFDFDNQSRIRRLRMFWDDSCVHTHA
jgi:steroid delta-isomerase